MRRDMRLNANWNTGNSVILAGSIMTESEFLALIDQVLNSIESQADDWAASLDVDVETSRSGNVLTMVFEDNTHV
ncbi:frataxin domain-containing protein, partial [Campylobacter coli]|uniref:frataxin domain-containing protein n=1 Tax=Campylobacter coli TaxID=195 RepID=UPI0034E08162